MLSRLFHCNLKQRLMLFSLLPLLMMIFFGTSQAYLLYKDYRFASENRQVIKITTQIAQLLYLLHTSPNLSTQADSHETPQEPHNLQQRITLALTALLEAKSLKKIQQELDQKRGATTKFETSLTALTRLNQNLQQLPADAFAQNPRAFKEFRNELDNQLTQLLQQLQLQMHKIAQGRSYNELLRILKIQSIAAEGRDSINSMLLAESLRTRDYQRINNIILDYRSTVANISSMSLAAQHLISQFQISSTNQQLLKISQQIQHQLVASALVQDISSHLGYGALQAGFHKYLLTGDESALAQFNQAHAFIEENIDKLANEFHDQPEKLAVVKSIRDTIEQYQIAIEQLQQLDHQSVKLSQLKKLTQLETQNINDAIGKLLSPPHPLSSQEWLGLADDLIQRLHGVSTEITDSMAQLCEHNLNKSLILLVLFLVTAISTVAATAYIGRKIAHNLANTINGIADDMHQMAENPELDLLIHVSGSDELTRMAQAMNHMITERHLAKLALSRAGAVFNHSTEGIVVTDANNRIELVNPAFSLITGYSLDEVKGCYPSILSSKRHPKAFYASMWETLYKHNKWEGEIWNHRKNGEEYPEFLAITLVRNAQGEVIQHIGLFMDISKRKQYEQDLWRQTNFDALTGLPNRNLFNDRLRHDIGVALLHSSKLALLMLDLDLFKYINDVQGHATGDLLLQAVGKRLEKAADNGFIARVGGDGFGFIFPSSESFTLEQMVSRIIDAFAQPFTIDERDIQISASMGISTYPDNGSDASTLVRNAEMAMFQAKDDGRNNVKYFAASMNDIIHARVELEQRLRRALSFDEFILYYQPIVDMQTGRVSSVEALIRWQDPEFGLIPPDKFIAIAEETGLVESMGNWVLNQAISDLKRWHDQGIAIDVAINVSSRQCINPRGMSFDKVLEECCERHQIHPKHVHVEITESMLMDDIGPCLTVLKSICELGAPIYMDDFGTGYSSLSYLKKFPISVIKIDRAFVDNALNDTSSGNLVKAIVTMGQSLEMELVAEGIENEAQWRFLQSLGCHYGQGYLLSKPLPFDKITPLLASPEPWMEGCDKLATLVESA